MRGRFLQSVDDYDDFYDPGQAYNSRQIMPVPVPESPETAVARSVPSSAIHLLDNESRRRHYVEALDIGAKIASILLTRVSPESLDNIADVRIEPEKKMGIFGFSRTKGMKISFRRLYA